MSETDNIKGTFLPSGCLSEQGLIVYLNTPAKQVVNKKIQLHLEKCELCRLAVKGFESTSGTGSLFEDNRNLHARIDQLINDGQIQTVNDRKRLRRTGPKGMLRHLTDLRNIAAILPLMLLLGSVLWLTAALQMVDQRISGMHELYRIAAPKPELPEEIEEIRLHQQDLSPPSPQISEFLIRDYDLIPEDDLIIEIEEEFTLDYELPALITGMKEMEAREIFIVVEEPPIFPGGHDALLRYLSENIRYPRQASSESIQGTVYLTFVININGKVEDVRVLRGVHSLLDDEAVRVIRDMPEWIPGKQRGKPVRVQFTMPVRFKLD